ncbi:MAG: F0F1 ATP synthase subunit gamma [Paludibacter sp.]|nr:F0F1 ATP synthase subunit gamma [Paludibacter sp.]
MSSLKEIKTRIQSVKSTQKITSAMKMVSSAKLRKAEKTIENFYPYEEQLDKLLTNFLSDEGDIISPLIINREVKQVAIIVFSSNSSLCGSFNSNVNKLLNQTILKYNTLGNENIMIYPVGKKVSQACVKMGFVPAGNFEDMANKPTYEKAIQLADEMMHLFNDKSIDSVEIIYHHFQNKSSQVLKIETYLPIQLKPHPKNVQKLDYIVEPSRDVIMNDLIPKVLRLKLYTALLDSNASEHAARSVAMQIATDNANDLLQELSLLYNKSRQQAITNELLDIMGGLFK